MAADQERRVRSLVEGSSHMTVATADESGKPWVSPVFFVPDDNYSLYWISSKSAVHSANIRRRPQVAITIFVGGDPEAGIPADAVYFDAEAVELNDEREIADGIAVYRTRDQPPKFQVTGADQVTGEAAWRLYRATPVAAFTREDDVEGGQPVTVRAPVDLKALIGGAD